MKTVNSAVLGLCFSFLFACQSDSKLPILGEKVLDETTGKLEDYKAPDFVLTNQLNQTISSESLSGKIQVIDFFFTTCPTICPQMTNHLTLVQEAYREEDRVHILSYSIDATHDTPEQLNRYANAYGINSSNWSLLTGKQDVILELSKDFKVRAFEEMFAGNRNLIHDGTFVLIDAERRIRGYYNGLEVADTERLIADIGKLLRE